MQFLNPQRSVDTLPSNKIYSKQEYIKLCILNLYIYIGDLSHEKSSFIMRVRGTNIDRITIHGWSIFKVV